MNVARNGGPLKLDRKGRWFGVGVGARGCKGRASFGGFQARKVRGSEEGEVREGGEGWGVRMGCRGARAFQIRKVVWGWCARFRGYMDFHFH